MGGAVSAGEDNEELVDNLVEADYVKTPNIENALRAVDRGHYYLKEFRDTAYKDLAWKNGNLHLSAPCIYSEVLECLKLSPGQSFLNLGSGTGYLSTVAGLLLGAYGINHGVEQHADVVKYANERLLEFLQQSPGLDMMEFSRPHFIVGNCLQLEPSCSVQAYDRVYCGAAVPPEYIPYVRNLVKIGGIAVMPSGDQLLRIQRVKEDVWETKNILPVSFATLVEPSAEERANSVALMLPDRVPLTLQEMCRETVRSVLRKRLYEENPEFTMRSVLLTKKRRSTGGSRTNSETSNPDGTSGAARRRRRFIQRILIPVFHAESDDDDEPEPQQHHPDGDESEDDDNATPRGENSDGPDGPAAAGGGSQRRSRRPVIAIGTAGISRRSGGRLHMEGLRWNRFILGTNTRRASSLDEDSDGSMQQRQLDDDKPATETVSTEEDIRDSLDYEQQLLLSGGVDGDGHTVNEDEEDPNQIDESGKLDTASSGPELVVETNEPVKEVDRTESTRQSDTEDSDTASAGPKNGYDSQSTTRSIAGTTSAGDVSITTESSKRSHSESEVSDSGGARRKRAAAVPPECHPWRGAMGSDGESDGSDEMYREEQRKARQRNVEMQKKFTKTIMQKISKLPIPDSLKAYLNYFRDFE